MKLSHAEIEKESGVSRDTFRRWFSRGNKPWSVRTAEENYKSYSRKIPEETIEKMRISKLGSKNPMWKGDEAKEHSVRNRLRRRIPAPKGSDRHHIDGNGRNSDPNNILVQTRREHMIDDGRIEALVKRNKMWRGRKHSPETIEKMRAVKLGKKHTLESIEKRRAGYATRRRDEKGRFKKRAAPKG